MNWYETLYIRYLTARLKNARRILSLALLYYSPKGQVMTAHAHATSKKASEKEAAANPAVLDALAQEVAADIAVMQQAATFIAGEPARIQSAVDAAIAGGATAEQLAPIQAEIDAMIQNRTDLANAIAAANPTPPTPPTP